MPMRDLIYLGMIYSKYAENPKNRINLYSKVLQKFPLPKLVCFYNGTSDSEERTEQHLRDAFDTSMGEPDVDVKVLMLNINHGKNKELMNSCQALQEYAWLIDRIRQHKDELGDLEAALDKAIDEMPDKALLKPFILANKAEVKRMCITEYDEAKTMEMFKEEGRAEGRTDGQLKILYDLVNDQLISLEEAAHRMNLTEEEFIETTKKYAEK